MLGAVSSALKLRVSCLTTKDHYDGTLCLRGDITWDLDDFKLEDSC